MDRTAQPTITFRENFVEIVRNGITGSAYYCQYDNDPAKAVTEETARKPLHIDRCDRFYSCWTWKNTVGDMDRYGHGLVCKTREEATKLSKEIRNKVKETKYCG